MRKPVGRPETAVADWPTGVQHQSNRTGWLPAHAHVSIELPMGGGSGTSPALSVSGDTVYSADGDGNMLAVDSYSGEVRWSAKGEGLLSPAIGPDDTIYTGNIFAVPTVIALTPDNGSIKWTRSYDDAAARVLPVLEPYWWGSCYIS